ncbi:MAG: pimeloyl-ACP methyl ester carboxylesterase [Parasphingorhabdus sp.]|jgi:pimeloyl-ACP methyl ester carboxylesterase
MTVQYFINRRNQKLAYDFIPGRRPTIVFLGGYKSEMTGTKGNWLANYCQCLGHSYFRFDYSGHGQSDGEFADGTIGEWSEDAFEIISQLTDGPLILVGSSMGGWIMLLTALRLSSRLAALVGIAPAPDFTRDLMWPGFSQEQQNTLQEKGVIFLQSDYDDETYPVRYSFIEDGNQHCLLDKKIDISCPVRLLHGMKDDQVPWQTSLSIEQKLISNDVQVILFKSGDHRLSESMYLNSLTNQIDLLLQSGSS